MSTKVAVPHMTGEEMIALSKKHTLYEWSVQSKVDPLPVAKAKGIYFWTPEGTSVGRGNGRARWLVVRRNCGSGRWTQDLHRRRLAVFVVVIRCA